MILPLTQSGEVWSADNPEAFEAITLHAIGWRLHDFHVGNGGLLWPPGEALILRAPVRVVSFGDVAMRIVVRLTDGTDRPFVVLDPKRESQRVARAYRPWLVLDFDEE